MGEPATAMRDPIFYRWHAFIDDMFQEYKATLGGYSVQDVNTIQRSINYNTEDRFCTETNLNIR